ncbi:MAG: phosphoribosylglycinamide formyltransferase, partial [Oscillospiraceae bacterium]|nr:phosphoribosylglycinamide formyltransferase [Oscillospiraceae bacterium]
MKHIIVLVSGGGTNLQALIDQQEQGNIKNGKISCVISSNPDAYALQRAEKHGIKSRVLSRKEFQNNHTYSLALLD